MEIESMVILNFGNRRWKINVVPDIYLKGMKLKRRGYR